MLLVGGMCDLNGAGPADMAFLNDAFEYDFELRWWRQARARSSLHPHSRASQALGSMEPKLSFLDGAFTQNAVVSKLQWWQSAPLVEYCTAWCR